MLKKIPSRWFFLFFCHMDHLKSDTRSISSHWKVHTPNSAHHFRMSRAPPRTTFVPCVNLWVVRTPEQQSCCGLGGPEQRWSRDSRERDWVLCVWHMAAKRKTRYQNFIYKIHNYRQHRWGRLHKIFEEKMIEEFNVSFESYCLSRYKKMFIVKWIFTETGCKQHKCPTIS